MKNKYKYCKNYWRNRMKITNKSIILLVTLSLCAFNTAYGDGIKKVAQTGMKWLSIPTGARASAMGGAFTAMAGGTESIFWNPAGIAHSEGHTVLVNQTQWIADISVFSSALTFDAGKLGMFGVTVTNVDWGTINGTRRADTDAGYEETGTFSPTNYAFGVSYGKKISSQFSFGGQVKYIHENLGSNLEGSFDESSEYTADMNVLAMDVGTLYYTGFKDLRFGMSLQNFSAEVKYLAEYFPLPLTFRFGLAMDLMTMIDEDSDHKVTLAVDALHPRDYSERLHFGCEYQFKDLFFLRTGYKTNYDEESMSFGGGLNVALSNLLLSINYSYIAFDHFDAVNMVSFDFRYLRN